MATSVLDVDRYIIVDRATSMNGLVPVLSKRGHLVKVTLNIAADRLFIRHCFSLPDIQIIRRLSTYEPLRILTHL
ncbi:hypothetical protein BG60_24340 [Caballeronia zhejiangensis]|uniref:Uncharacterized protein n=1 Tax=Caballeronia zhejiangensis TaxID=871203 RepID=A0A656QCH0_9BURK|nr:hypothetical protein BG58_31735 [Caballeronia jiangsuensis]KDR26126.1 hypothetical protein BG60_24340 [Caballeronia zhejiangensis]KWU24299.1 hypothetical protein AS149_34475 [Burkholderia cenocepacia]